jgi:hypothetical protein
MVGMGFVVMAGRGVPGELKQALVKVGILVGSRRALLQLVVCQCNQIPST